MLEWAGATFVKLTKIIKSWPHCSWKKKSYITDLNLIIKPQRDQFLLFDSEFLHLGKRAWINGLHARLVSHVPSTEV